MLIDNGDEAYVICKDINVISGWDCDRNFELRGGDQVFVGLRPS